MIPRYHTLIFEGGGVRGYAYAEALKALEEKGIINLQEITTFAGSSAGAITAALLACGATPRTLQGFLEIDFNIFQDDKVGWIRDAWNLWRHWGYCEGKTFVGWFKECLKKIISYPDASKMIIHYGNEPTFKNIQRHTGKNLIITASNFSTGKLQLFTPETTPDVPIWLAVRASMAIPLFFRPIRYKGDWLWDGGVLANLYDPKGDGGELALRLVGNDDYGQGKRREIKNLKDVGMCVIDIMQYQQERKHISKSLWENMISINVGKIKATDFDLISGQKQQLALAGREGVERFVVNKGKK